MRENKVLPNKSVMKSSREIYVCPLACVQWDHYIGKADNKSARDDYHVNVFRSEENYDRPSGRWIMTDSKMSNCEPTWH